MQKKWLLISGSGLLLVALIAIGVVVWALPAVRSSAPALLTQAQPPAPLAQTGPELLTGSYQGAVTLQWTLPGVYSDPLPTPTPGGAPAPDLGAVDLALWVNRTGEGASGYVALDETLIFSVEHTINATPVGPTPQPGTPTAAPVALKIGPQFQGTVTGAQFALTSEKITDLINGKPIERQFRLSGTVTQPSATELLLTGEYRETVWGYTLQPVTVIGAFTLSQTLFPTPTPMSTVTATATLPPPTNTPTNTPVPPTNTPTATPPAGSVQLPLVTGWNLVALPRVPASGTPNALFAPIVGSYDLVYAYDGCVANNPWRKYNPSGPPFANTLTTISVTQGLWVRATSPVTLTVTGAAPANTSIPLCAGWNLITYPGNSATPIATALAGIAGQYNLVYTYEASTPANPWKKYNPSGPPFANTLSELKPGKGYWIRVTQATTLPVP